MAAILPGVVRQTGYVVRDIDRALPHWVDSLGIGPWIVLNNVMLDPCEYRGQSVTTPIRIALAQSGELQIELIEPLDDSPSCYKEFFDAGHEGLHHLAWWADDYDAAIAAAAGAGWGTIQSGDLMGTRFCYLDTPVHPGTVAELMELTDATRWLAGHVREAAETWDGVTDPVRTLG